MSRTADRPVSPRIRWFRAVRLRCPACGSRGVIHGWLRLAPECPGCHLRLDRGEPDHFLGGYVVNLGIAEGVAAILFIVLLSSQLPDPDWDLLQWAAAGLVVGTPLLMYPFTRLIFLATDLTMQPRRPGDFGDGDPTYK